MLNVILVAIAIAVLIVLTFAASKANTFVIERQVLIKTPAAMIFPFINDFRGWRAWSPFDGLDPDMRRHIGDIAAGVGAVYTWDGNKKAGAGRMEIIESTLPSHIRLRLDFTRPFEAHNTVVFTLSEIDGASTVTWAMHAPLSFMMKIMHVVLNIDKMLGRDFEKGLASLKALAESGAALPA